MKIILNLIVAGVLIALLLSYSCKRLKVNLQMEYRPNVEKTVEKYIIGEIKQDSTVIKGIKSPSVLTQDKMIEIKPLKNPISGEVDNDFYISYASSSFIHFEVGQIYLFAISDNECIGSLKVQSEDTVLLPDSTKQGLFDFMHQTIGKKFPDFFGLRNGINNDDEK